MNDGAGEVLWHPTAERIARSRVTAFRHELNAQLGCELADFEDLRRWSLDQPATFWRRIWKFCGVSGDGPGDDVLLNARSLTGARWFPDARLNYAENLLATTFDPTAPALVFRSEEQPDRCFTRGELRRAVAALATSLAADGVGPGDRVAGFLPNLPETVIAMLATASLGAVWSSCSPDFGLQAVRDRFGQIEPKVLISADGYRYGGKINSSLEIGSRLYDEMPSVQRWLVVPHVSPAPALPDRAVAWPDYADLHAGSEPDFARVPFNHPLFIMYSSGTTGLPKCMVHSVGGTLLQHLKEHQLHCDVGAGDRLFYYTTCGWMMWNWLVSGLASGATIMLFEGHPLRPASVIWDYAQEARITVLGTSARWLAACEKADLRPVRSHDLGALRAVLSTGSPLAPASFDYVYRDVKPDVQLSSISGGTDIISCFALGSPVLPVRRGELQCRGLGMAVDVFDERGRSRPGTKGELVCTAPFPSQPVSFWNDPDGTRYRAAYFARFPGVWCHGDFAEITPSGGMIIHGRSDTVLNPGGVRIGTAEVYRVVDRFPEVLESLVVGLQRDGDVRLALFLVLRRDKRLDIVLEESIKERLRCEASPRHVPAFVRQVPDLPRTISGKIVEKAVRDVLEGQEADNIEALANPQALEPFRQLAPELT